MTDSAFPTSEWGAYRPRGWGGFWLRVARRVPRPWPGSRLGLLARRLARLTMSGPVDSVIWGRRLRLFPRRGVSEARILFLPRFWDSAERTVLRDYCGAGAVFLDVGANVGGYTFWIDHVSEGTAQIVAIEADPELAAQLKYNVRTNGAEDRIAVIAAGVALEDGEGTLILDQGNRGENRVASTADDPAGGVTVTIPLRTLASVVVDRGLTRIDALKIDVEGNELEILDGFFAAVPDAVWPGLLIVELHGTEGVPASLAKRGYTRIEGTRLNGIFVRAARSADPLQAEGSLPADEPIQ